MYNKKDILSLFHPLIADWFRDRVGEPTEIQAKGWERIAKGEHVLITAPTGSGKTLTSFLWALNQWATGDLETGYTSVLYVSPLKALNNDIQRNLFGPLSELKKVFENVDQAFPSVRVMTRSGDTPQSDRRAMQRHPPEILITTPESLNLLLSSVGGRPILTNLKTVILDEIHDVLGSKRGVHLMTAVDRLVPLSGEFQRVALSATVKPLDVAASFIGGFRMNGSVENPVYRQRDVQAITTSAIKSYNIEIRFPEKLIEYPDQESIWKPIVMEIKERISRNRSTLIFTNSRRLCEKITLKINSEETAPIAYAHHGSLSREIRAEVEAKLKSGDLRAIVATGTLELGIDIGPLDEVILIQSPNSFSSTIQRVGRAGHQVRGTSIGTFFPSHDQDILEAAVLAKGIIDHDMAPVKPIQNPLDVLSQVLVSMTGVETWDMDTLFAQIKTSFSYKDLTRIQFDVVLNMLAGRFADTRLRELKPRLSIDRLDNTVSARKGALMALYLSGGTIPDRGYFRMRHLENNALIGDLDEEFVWEARIGQVFTLGTQNWRIERITHSDVFVKPASPKTMSAPFWKAEGINRDFHFSERLGLFLEEADERLNDPDFFESLTHEHCMSPGAVDRLIRFLKNQKESTGCGLPHRRHIVVEYAGKGPGSVPGNQVVIHTFWGGCVNRPYAMALDAAWEEKFGHSLEIFAGNDCLALLLPSEISPDEILSLVTSNNVHDFLRRSLEGSGYFGARFRECAGRALLLAKQKFNERVPLWISRLRSKKLMESILKYEDFPILLEAWRTCLQDEFEMDALAGVLAELESGRIQWSETRTKYPSPMARTISWRQVNEYMYMDDSPDTVKRSRLSTDLLKDLVLTPDLRPQVSKEIIERFEQKRKRLSPGYSPASERDLLDWIKERVIIPQNEWSLLKEAMKRDHGEIADEWIFNASEKIVEARPEKSEMPLLISFETAPLILNTLYGNINELPIRLLSSGKRPVIMKMEEQEGAINNILHEWMQFSGPIFSETIVNTLGIEKSTIDNILEDLLEEEKVIVGQLVVDGGDEDVCDSENFEQLLRLSRAEAQPEFEPMDIDTLPLFLASFQGIIKNNEGEEGTARAIEKLLCFPQPARRWEAETFPTRLADYRTSWLDSIMQKGDLRWIGGENQDVTFCFGTDLDLLQGEEKDDAEKTEEKGNKDKEIPVPENSGRYDFSTLLGLTNLRPQALADRLWKAVWSGKITNDSFMALRTGIETNFTAETKVDIKKDRRGMRRGGRRSFSRWKNSMPFAGNWFRLSLPTIEDDLIEKEERNRDRIRLLLDRYGIIFRELLQRESSPFQWVSLFRSIRLMEYSGEIVGGYFFKGIPGPQFMSHSAFRRVQRPLPEDEIWWMNATDPASPCGLPLDDLRESLPRRIEGNHIVYQGKKVIMISEGKGKNLTFLIPPDDALVQSAMMPIHHMLMRAFQPMRRIVVETINGARAAESPYLDSIRTLFDLSIDYRNVILYRLH